MDRAALNHRCGLGAEVCGVGAERAGATECGADIRGPAPRPIGVAPGPDRTPGDIVEMLELEPTELCTRGSAKPFCFTCWETFARLRTLPRGIPNPAESLRTIIRFGVPWPGKGPRFTITVCPGEAGGRGATNCRGGFTTRGSGCHPVQYPGCHTHPYAGRNNQEP